MKKFLVFCIILIVTVSLGATVYYFMRENEELVVDADPYIYVNAGTGEIVEIDAELKHAKVGRQIFMTSLNEDVLVYNEVLNAFEPVKGGMAIIEIKTNNAKIPAIYIEVSIGNGTKEAPYFIDSKEDLANIGSEDFPSTSHYILMQDITLSSNFTPILSGVEAGFGGSLNGNDYAISGLNVTTSEGVNNAGLFAKIASTGVVTNVTLNDVNINGQFETAGSIAGINLGTVNRCSVTGSVISTLQNSNVGGLVGINKYSNANVGRIDRCSSSVAVSGTYNIGGLAGKNEGAIIINSYANLSSTQSVETIAEGANIGGLVGYNTNLNSQVATIKNCYSNAQVVAKEGLNAENIKMASLVGFNDEISKEASNNLMGVYADNAEMKTINNEFERTFSNSEQSLKTNFRGLYSTFPRDDNNAIISGELISFVAKQLDSESNVLWDFTNVWSLDANINNGYPTLNKMGASVPDDLNLIYDPSKINTAADLIALANDVKNGTAGAYYALADNITLTGDFTPIGTVSNPFNGTFDGNGFTITGLNIASTTIENLGDYKNRTVGLFGKISSTAVVKNFTLSNVSIADGAQYAGAIVGYSEGTIQNVKVTQTARNKDTNNIVASSAVGGIAGVSLGLIENCKVENQTIVSKSIDVNSGRYAGGIAGLNGVESTATNAIIKNSSVVTCYVYDSEENTDFPAGFVSDFNSWTNGLKETLAYATAMTKTVYFVGGIAGANYYQIKSNYVYNTDLEIDEYSIKGTVSGIVGLSKGTALLNQGLAEVSYNKIINGTISGFIASGLVGHLYGIANYNHVEVDTIYGLILSGLVNDIKIDGRLNNCFVKAHLTNSYTWGCASGMVSYARFNSSSSYGEFKTIFSACTFESTNEYSKYDSNAQYRTESNGLWDTRRDGYGNYLIWVETGHAKFENPFIIGGTSINNVYGISNDEAILIKNEQATINLFTANGFDTEHWEFATMQYPSIIGLPEIEEIV